MSNEREGEDSTRPNIDDLLIEWRDEWLDAIYQHVCDMHYRRMIHNEFMDMLEAQDHPHRSYFEDVFHGMYIESQVLAIRRLTDPDSQTLSLHRLLGQLFEHRLSFTRQWYVDRWMGDRNPDSEELHERLDAKFHRERANTDFDRFIDKPGADVLGGRGLQEDREDLAEVTERVVHYANAYVAHTQRERDGVTVTYGEFDRALDHLGEMLKKYYLLIDQGGIVSVVPTPQGDWKGPFRSRLAEPFPPV